MTKDYDVMVRYHIDGVPKVAGIVYEETIRTRASSSAIALKLGRRALHMDNAAAVIETAEIVFPDLPPGPADPFARVAASEMTAAEWAAALQPAPLAAPDAAAVAAELEAARLALMTDPKVKIGAGVMADFIAERSQEPTGKPIADPEDTTPEPESAPQADPDAAAAIAKLQALGPEAVQAFAEAIDEFLAAPGKQKTWKDEVAREKVTFRLQVFKKGTGPVAFFGTDRRKVA